VGEHWQACFDVNTRRCVCPIGTREARVCEAAPKMEALLRSMEFSAGERANACPVCYMVEAHSPGCALAALLTHLGAP
jgi:hypothetical protein